MLVSDGCLLGGISFYWLIKQFDKKLVQTQYDSLSGKGSSPKKVSLILSKGDSWTLTTVNSISAANTKAVQAPIQISIALTEHHQHYLINILNISVGIDLQLLI